MNGSRLGIIDLADVRGGISMMCIYQWRSSVKIKGIEHAVSISHWAVLVFGKISLDR
jgi:hypothetical protein